MNAPLSSLNPVRKTVSAQESKRHFLAVVEKHLRPLCLSRARASTKRSYLKPFSSKFDSPRVVSISLPTSTLLTSPDANVVSFCQRKNKKTT